MPVRRAVPRVAVLGAGISGLAAAHRLGELARAAGRDVACTVFDARDRPGGIIATEHHGPYQVEAGPDAMLTEKPAGIGLCDRLGLSPRLIGTRAGYRRTYTVHRGRPVPLPDGFMLLSPTRIWPVLTSPLFSWPAKLRMALEPLVPATDRRDESLASFVRRRFGRAVLERAAQPLVGGIYTADPERLSLAATMPRFLEMERAGGVIRASRRRARLREEASGARWGLFASFDGGMQVLVDALVARLPRRALRLGHTLRSLRREGEQWCVDGTLFDAVVATLPTHALAPLVSPLDAPLAAELAAVPYASSAAVTLAYPREAFVHPLDGFGMVVPAVEHRAILALSFSSLKYPYRAPAGDVLVRTFLGGALQPELLALDDAGLLAATRAELAALFGVRGEPMLSLVHRYERAMPQYHVGHLARVERLEARAAGLPRFALAGSAYRGVGLPDCIASGEAAARSVWDALGGPPFERRRRSASPASA